MFKAKDTRSGKLVAVKQMVIAKQIKKEILVNEIKIMSESKHENIVQYIDSFLVGPSLWVFHLLIIWHSFSLSLIISNPKLNSANVRWSWS